MAHILQNIPPQYVPVFRVELLDEQFDDAEIEQLETSRLWAQYNEQEVA